MEIKSILFPTDFSEGSLYALPYAVDMAKACGARLYLFHVICDIALTSALYVPYACVDPLYKELEEAAAGELQKLRMESSREVEHVEYATARGLPREEILQFAREKSIDLIVISTHGRTGIDRVLFGSTTEAVVRNALCPVLTVRVRREVHQDDRPDKQRRGL